MLPNRPAIIPVDVLLDVECTRTSVIQTGSATEAKGKHPIAKLPSSLLVVGKFLAKQTLLLILIGEIDLDFVFLISVHCMLQSSGGFDAAPASSVQCSGYPSPPAKRHCPGIDPAASAVPPPPPPPPQGSGGDGPSRRAPSPPPSQGHAEEPCDSLKGPRPAARCGSDAHSAPTPWRWTTCVA